MKNTALNYYSYYIFYSLKLFVFSEDGELYAGTSYNFLGSEPIIFRNSQQSPLRTEYAIPWLNGKEAEGKIAREKKYLLAYS